MVCRWVGVGIAGVLACGPSVDEPNAGAGHDAGDEVAESSDEDGGAEQPVEGVVSDPSCPETDGAIVAAYGTTGVLFEQATCDSKGIDCDNIQMLRNVIECLAAGRERDGRIAILYTNSCDPRIDDDLCKQGAWENVEPFFSMVDAIGYVDFNFPSGVPALDDYSVVVADMCGDAAPLTAERELLAEHVRKGGRVFVLGGHSCEPVGGPSAEFANLILEELGTSFTDGDPPIESPLLIPEHRQAGLLEGVERLLIWRITPQRSDTQFSTVFAGEEGPLLTIRGW